MRWFRMYADVLHDTKVRSLSDRDFRWWVSMLCVACSRGGSFTVEDVKSLTGHRLDHCQQAASRLLAVGLLSASSDASECARGDVLIPTGWAKRQFASDVSTERVRKHRAGRNVSETAIETPPDTDTDTDKKNITSETSSDAPIRKGGREGRLTYPEPFERLWSTYPSRPNQSKKAALTRWRALDDESREAAQVGAEVYAEQVRRTGVDPNYIPHLERWLKGRRFDEFVEYDDAGTEKNDGRGSDYDEPDRPTHGGNLRRGGYILDRGPINSARRGERLRDAGPDQPTGRDLLGGVAGVPRPDRAPAGSGHGPDRGRDVAPPRSRPAGEVAVGSDRGDAVSTVVPFRAASGW